MQKGKDQDEKKEMVSEPGRTPGSAEGDEVPDSDHVEDPGRTPGSAEGEDETVEKALHNEEDHRTSN